MDIEKIVNQVQTNKGGVYVVSASEKTLFLQNPGVSVLSAGDEKSIVVAGQPAFYIFKI